MALFVKYDHSTSFNLRITEIRQELSLENVFISRSLYTGIILIGNNWTYAGSSDAVVECKWCSGNPRGNQLAVFLTFFIFILVKNGVVLASPNGWLATSTSETFINQQMCIKIEIPFL